MRCCHAGLADKNVVGLERVNGDVALAAAVVPVASMKNGPLNAARTVDPSGVESKAHTFKL